MSTWDAANRIEELAYKIHSVKCVIEMAAEAISTETESGALWAASEMLEHLSEEMEKQSSVLMDLYKSEKVKKK